MLVTVTGFGSVWQRRFGKDENDQRVRPAYFNTTGVPVNGTMRTRPKIAGHVRFSGVEDFDPLRPFAMINTVFECAEPSVWNGQNKVRFKRILRDPQQPDWFLVVVRAAEIGHLDAGSSRWRSEGTLLISFSQYYNQQEAMLLMRAKSWLRTDFGRFELRPFVNWPWIARLELERVEV